jgi:NAD-dependent deacetylase
MHIVFFTGAGMSAESGLGTFRDSGGLWERFRIEDVATPESWRKNPALVLDFYNQRYAQLVASEPNSGHKVIANLQKRFCVSVITHNVDDLHERAGTKDVLHLHGELMYVRSTEDPKLRYKRKGLVQLGDACERGSQLRPDVVWFGEEVPNMEEAKAIVARADIFVVVGTSLQVYPAASLLQVAEKAKRIIVIDSNSSFLFDLPRRIEKMNQSATEGLRLLGRDLSNR